MKPARSMVLSMRLPVELEDVQSALRIGIDGRLATRARVWWKNPNLASADKLFQSTVAAEARPSKQERRGDGKR